MPELPKHSVSVAGVVIDAVGQVLVIQRRDNGQWEIPGGVLELDESPQMGVRREVAEETGVRVRVEGLSGVYKNMARAVVALVFRCHPESGSPHSTVEAAQARWISLDEVRQLMLPAFAVRVLDAFDGQPQIRVHDGVNLLPG